MKAVEAKKLKVEDLFNTYVENNETTLVFEKDNKTFFVRVPVVGKIEEYWDSEENLKAALNVIEDKDVEVHIES